MGLQLKYYRSLRGLRQDDLAAYLNISRTNISSYEKGHSAPNLENLVKLSRILRVSIDELLGNEGQPWAIQTLPAEEWTLIKQLSCLPEEKNRMVKALAEIFYGEEEKGMEEMIPLYASLSDLGRERGTYGRAFRYVPRRGAPEEVHFAVCIGREEDRGLGGATVYVGKQDIQSGDAGIFQVGDMVLCRRYQADGDGILYLEDMTGGEAPLRFDPEKEWDMKCHGKVIFMEGAQSD